MRDSSIPWLLGDIEGLRDMHDDMHDGLSGGPFLLHGLHDSEPATLLDTINLSSSGFDATTATGTRSGSGLGGALPLSPDLGGFMEFHLDTDVLTGGLGDLPALGPRSRRAIAAQVRMCVRMVRADGARGHECACD